LNVFLSRYESFCDFLNKIVGLVEIILMTTIIVSVVLQISSRMLSYPVPWTEELTRFAFIWGVMLGSTVCTLHRSHAVVTTFRDRFPQKILPALTIATQVLILICAAVLVLYGQRMIFLTRRQISPALGIRMSFINLAVPACGVLHFIYTFKDFLQAVFTPKDFFKVGGDH